MKGIITKKVVVWITLISFVLNCTGCYSVYEGEHYSSRLTYAGERRAAAFERDVIEFWAGLLVFAVLLTSVISGHSHGHYSAGHSHHR